MRLTIRCCDSVPTSAKASAKSTPAPDLRQKWPLRPTSPSLSTNTDEGSQICESQRHLGDRAAQWPGETSALDARNPKRFLVKVRTPQGLIDRDGQGQLTVSHRPRGGRRGTRAPVWKVVREPNVRVERLDRSEATCVRGLRTAPSPQQRAAVHHGSGRPWYVSDNRRLADACHWWGLRGVDQIPPAPEHTRAAGDTHNAALCNLANKLIAKLLLLPTEQHALCRIQRLVDAQRL
jgi:hypothetical protein